MKRSVPAELRSVSGAFKKVKKVFNACDDGHRIDALDYVIGQCTLLRDAQLKAESRIQQVSDAWNDPERQLFYVYPSRSGTITEGVRCSRFSSAGKTLVDLRRHKFQRMDHSSDSYKVHLRFIRRKFGAARGIQVVVLQSTVNPTVALIVQSCNTSRSFTTFDYGACVVSCCGNHTCHQILTREQLVQLWRPMMECLPRHLDSFIRHHICTYVLNPYDAKVFKSV